MANRGADDAERPLLQQDAPQRKHRSTLLTVCPFILGKWTTAFSTHIVQRNPASESIKGSNTLTEAKCLDSVMPSSYVAVATDSQAQNTRFRREEFAELDTGH